VNKQAIIVENNLSSYIFAYGGGGGGSKYKLEMTELTAIDAHLCKKWLSKKFSCSIVYCIPCAGSWMNNRLFSVVIDVLKFSAFNLYKKYNFYSYSLDGFLSINMLCYFYELQSWQTFCAYWTLLCAICWTFSGK
jgi:hypothetical protein